MMVLKPSIPMESHVELKLHKLPHLAINPNGFTLEELAEQLDAHLVELSPYHSADERGIRSRERGNVQNQESTCIINFALTP